MSVAFYINFKAICYRIMVNFKTWTILPMFSVGLSDSDKFWPDSVSGFLKIHVDVHAFMKKG